MKKLLIFFSLLLLIAACHKDKKPINNNGGNTDTTYKAPYNLTRYTKKIAGMWNWHGWYWNGSIKIDSGGIFEITYINDTTIKFRDTFFYYRQINTKDSDLFVHYINPAFDDLPNQVEGISYWYNIDSLFYDKAKYMGNELYLTGHR